MNALTEKRPNRFDLMSSAERIQIAFESTARIRELLARLIQIEMGAISEERLKWELAFRLYGHEDEVCALLKTCEPDDEFRRHPMRRSVGLHTLGIAEPERINL